MGYYADLIKQKQNAKEDVEKIKSQIVSVKAYLKDRLEKQKNINKEVEGTQRELERLEKLLGQNNSKEEKENAEYSKYLTAEEIEYLKKVDFPHKHDVHAQKIFEKYVKAKNKEEREKGNAIEYTTISQKEWDDLKRHGYTDIIGGIKYALIGHPTKGTILAPVKINEKGYYAKLAEEKASRKH